MNFAEFKRFKLFAIIIDSDNDQLFNKVDEYLRSVGYNKLADAFTKLSRDTATEHHDDKFIPDVRDFGDVKSVENVITQPTYIQERPDLLPAVINDEENYVYVDELISKHEIVTEERFSILRDIAQVLKTHGSDLEQAFDKIVAEYEGIIASVSPSSAPKPPVLGM